MPHTDNSMPLIMDVSSSPPISRDLEALYRKHASTTTTATSHQVVTLPTTRGRETVGSPVRRTTRSLSAPRTHTRAAELVQNLYNRMGVQYAYGQGTDFQSSPLVDPIERRTRPTTPTTSSSSSNGSLYGGARKSPPPETAPFGVSSSHRQAGEISRSVHDRYRPSSTSSRGRTSERLSVEAQLQQEAPTITRTRSLSRGRVASRWPPVRTSEQPVERASPFVPPLQTSSSFGQPKASPPRGSPATTSRPTWMEPSGASYNSNSSRSFSKETPAEEKKEEVAPDTATTPVSMKERIRLYGSQAGVVADAVVEPKARTVRRSVDPVYAAQFAVRAHPPQIDIFRQAPTTTDAATDSSTAASPTTATARTTPKKAGLAQSYMSSISPATNASKALPREIAVGDLGLQPHQQLQPTDSHSITGLSTMSGDDNYSFQGGGGSKTTAAKRNTWRKAVASSVPPPPAAPPLVSEAHVERLLEERVEERVKSQMAQLEEKMDARLRLLVGAMEERVMLRLDSLERKLVTGGSLD